MKSFDHWELVNHKIRQKSKFLAMYDFLAIILIYDCSAPGNDKSYQYFFFLFFFFFFFFFFKFLAKLILWVLTIANLGI